MYRVMECNGSFFALNNICYGVRDVNPNDPQCGSTHSEVVTENPLISSESHIKSIVSALSGLTATIGRSQNSLSLRFRRRLFRI